VRNARIQNLATPPSSPVPGQIYFDTSEDELKFFDGIFWRTTFEEFAKPIGTAGGELGGTYPNPVVADGVIDNANISASAAIELSKLAVDPLGRANHTGTQAAATISDFDLAVRTNRLDQLAVPSTNVDVNGQRLTNLAEPVSGQDAATKAYVDAASMGLSVKEAVRAATLTNITLSAVQTIDGVVLNVGDRVLVKNQTNAAQNGLYVVSSGSWTRSSDATLNVDVQAGLFAFVEEGSVNADSGFVLATDNPIDVGSTDLSFVQFTGAGQINAGLGLTKSGNTLDVNGTADRISTSSDAVDIAATYAGQGSIVTLGTITSGAWNGDTVAVAHGGTGAITPTAARTNLGATTKYAVLNGGTTTDVIGHALSTTDVVVSVKDVATLQLLEADIFVTDANTVTIQYVYPPDAGSLRITVIG
jgi:hypothetical protein